MGKSSEITCRPTADGLDQNRHHRHGRRRRRYRRHRNATLPSTRHVRDGKAEAAGDWLGDAR